jgi:hypothetical protein
VTANEADEDSAGFEALGREGRIEGAAGLLARFEPELQRVRSAAVAAMAGERRQ